LALKGGEIDVVGYELTIDLYLDAVADANLVVAPVDDFGMYQFDLNNNATLPSAPGYRSPMNYVALRRATALLTNKNYIVNTICGGFAARIDAAVATPCKAWANQSYWDPHYPYEYDPALAAFILDTTFPQGPTPNPYYESTFPGSAECLRTYPLGHAKAGQDLDPLVVCVRSDDPRRPEAGRLLYSNLRKHGIPITAIEGPSSALYDRVRGDRDYHLYTGGWSVGRFPPLTVYELYRTGWWPPPWGQNFVTGYACDGQPNYPRLDQLLDAVRFGHSFDDILRDFRKAMGYFTEQCITIPLWTPRAFWAYSTEVVGVVSKEGYGLKNGYTFMNAYKVDGSPIHYGLAGVPAAMNVMYSDLSYDYQCLDRLTLYGGMDEPPYALSTLQAGFVQDWDVSEWVDASGYTKTKITKYFRSDAAFAEPVTGSRGATVNATHYVFSAWYTMQLAKWWYDQFSDVHHIDIVNDFQVDISFDSYSYWNIYATDGPLLPVDRWLQPPLAYNATETFVEGINLTSPGIVTLSGKPVWIAAVEADGTPLAPFTDYNIVGHGPANGRLEIFTDLPNSTVVVVDYWQLGNSAGDTPGDLPWQTIFEGAGMYYAVDFVPGEGGYLALQRNPHFWMETPPLGELAWTWTSGPHPRSGAFKVDIYDMVLAANAYGSHGTHAPDKTWFLGADLAPSGGQVDIFDVVTAAGSYGTSFATPP
jgi:hypothetical protein